MMGTYQDLQLLVKRTHDRVMQSCWIADVKAKNGLPMRSSRRKGPRVKPCPDEWRPVIEDAMRKLGWM
ncbi:hypothetical protein [Paraburkholderia tropica]|uniref:hypothetical protein n=1 Tax=Paraburkholderia tropica TaxID=92647 RepID=UPI002AB087F8|nr:hypothetical protein [Paraburkholderia tropica]